MLLECPEPTFELFFKIFWLPEFGPHADNCGQALLPSLDALLPVRAFSFFLFLQWPSSSNVAKVGGTSGPPPGFQRKWNQAGNLSSKICSLYGLGAFLKVMSLKNGALDSSGVNFRGSSTRFCSLQRRISTPRASNISWQPPPGRLAF